MDNWEVLKEEIIKTADNYRDEMFKKIDDAKNSELLNAVRSLSTRLTAIEERLPPKEDD